MTATTSTAPASPAPEAGAVGQRRREIPAPHPDWAPDDLVRRAGELVEVLRQRGERTEAEGRILAESNDEFVEAGFYRVLQPRVFGGYEFGLPTFVKVVMEIARGCPSSGWVLALTSGHAVLLSAFFSEDAQIDVYGENGEFRGPSSTPPRVKALKVDGGYRLSGAWDYASGIDISTHFIGGIAVHHAPDEPAVETRMALLDRDEYEIVDNWHVFGMHGTGSRRVTVNELFVPELRTIIPPRDAFNARNAPGRNVHANPMYCAGRLSSLLLEEMAAVAVGVAKGMLDAYEIEAADKPQMLDRSHTNAELPAFQRHWGEAWALVHMAEATVLKVAEDYMEYARAEIEDGVEFSDERDMQLQVLEQYATKLCGDAVDLLFRSGGTSSAQDGSLRQRYFRDMSVLNTHAAAQYERGAEGLGRIHLAGGVTPPVKAP
jgi:3-hydroxy-9,10-secoandrosta-1,3,5(10)-triene-9,17-dione monooxygenase